MKRLLWTIALIGFALTTKTHAAQEWVAIEGGSFVLKPSGKTFVPWGFNYDHDQTGRLLEDYWIEEWDRVREDFREMRELGANVVRVHLQLGRFMRSEQETDLSALDRLTKLLELAEAEGLYLNLTGLGCYHKTDVPAWYDSLDEQRRWQVQARFWRAVAGRCANSPAVFCYDLMNEPVVPGGGNRRDDWLGSAFAGKHFVQFISLDIGSRARGEVAAAWMKQLVDEIRQVDSRHLVTVGLVPWSLNQPGKLSSGFTPELAAEHLDFVSVHLYPEGEAWREELETLRAFAVGKPILIEETFPLKCSIEQFEQFWRGSRDLAHGWLGFYWGETPADLEKAGTIPAAMMLAWLRFFVANTPRAEQGCD